MMCHTASAVLRHIRIKSAYPLQRRCFSIDSIGTHNVNIQDKWGNTPLHHAILSKHSPSQITQLLTYGADTGIQNRSGLSPMDIAYTRLSEASRIFCSIPRPITLDQLAHAYRMYIALRPHMKNPLVNRDVPIEGTVVDAFLCNHGIRLDSARMRRGNTSLLEDMFCVCSDEELIPALYSYWSHPGYGHINPRLSNRDVPTLLHLAGKTGHANVVQAIAHVARMYAVDIQNWQYKAAYEDMHWWVRDRDGMNATSHLLYTLAQLSTAQDAHVMHGVVSQIAPNYVMRIGVHPGHVCILGARTVSLRSHAAL